jgi:tRNA modification GTPase
MRHDPIAALATAPGRSAIALVRLSGRGAMAIAAALVSSFEPDPPRVARLAVFRAPDGTPIDRGLYTVFPAPHSYTGEDLIEFSCHGGLLVPARLLSALHAAGARPAFPGEFTRRAVLNGKLDLIQAEAVGDVIDATVPSQARLALEQLEGGLSRRIGALREGLLDLQALLSYDLDFPEEDDGPVSPERIEALLREVASRIDSLLETAPAAMRLREGALVVLAGAPNAGKSSLFNALLGTERALVTELPGTTRDAIEAHADFSGWPVRLIDTAGVGETSNRIDRMGQAVSRKYIDAADLVLHCIETNGTDSPSLLPTCPPARLLHVRTKCDLGVGGGSGIAVSALTGEGLEALRRAVAERIFGNRGPLADLEPMLTRERHRVALVRAQRALVEVRPHLGAHGDAVLASHHIREATLALDELIGTVDIEQVLDRVFSAFCVGK